MAKKARTYKYRIGKGDHEIYVNMWQSEYATLKKAAEVAGWHLYDTVLAVTRGRTREVSGTVRAFCSEFADRGADALPTAPWCVTTRYALADAPIFTIDDALGILSGCRLERVGLGRLPLKLSHIYHRGLKNLSAHLARRENVTLELERMACVHEAIIPIKDVVEYIPPMADVVDHRLRLHDSTWHST